MIEIAYDCTSPSDFNSEAWRHGKKAVRDWHRSFAERQKLARMSIAELAKYLNEKDARRARHLSETNSPVEYHGETRTLGQWCAVYGIPIRAVLRIKRKVCDSYAEALDHCVQWRLKNGGKDAEK